ncbi:MAG: hypothetical protein ACLUIQ_01610 [Dialister invisus]
MWGKGQVAEVTGSGKHMMLKLIFPMIRFVRLW